jgi:hypothetical protein
VREDRRDLDDPPGARRQLRDELVAERLEAEQLDQFFDAPFHVAFGFADDGKTEHRVDG